MVTDFLRGTRFWDKIAKGYSKTQGSKWIRYPWIFKIINKVKNKKVLEIGCGTGTIINNLVKKGAIGIGIDNSRNMLKQAKESAIKKNLCTRFILLDAKNLKKYYQSISMIRGYSQKVREQDLLMELDK